MIKALRRKTERKSTDEDYLWMERALRLAALGKARTTPNPCVGAVLVKDGVMIASGWHRKAGSAHAEIHALRGAGRRAEGSTLYVTLEPCSTTGRTGPCTEAIIAAGISRVVVAASDPNPLHSGRGLSIIRKAGISVTENVMRAEAEKLLAPFAKWISTGKPYLTLKMAMSVDGRISDKNGRSKWITSPESRQAVKAYRGRVDAVMVGIETVLADNPSLYPLKAGKYQPLRVVVDSRGRTPLDCNLLNDNYAARTIVVAGRSCKQTRLRAIRAKGATVLAVKEKDGRVSLNHMMTELGKIGILHVYCEGGGRLAAGLLQDSIPDEYHFYIAPMIIGCAPEARPVFAGKAWSLDKAPQLFFSGYAREGDDLFVCYKTRREERQCLPA